jgi:hypothetical protein
MDLKIQQNLEELKNLDSSTAFIALDLEQYIKKLLLRIKNLEEANKFLEDSL